MKSTLPIFSLVLLWFSALAAPTPDVTLSHQLIGVDVIAIVTVTNVSKIDSTNTAGRAITAFVGEATVDRIIKGTPPKTIRVRDEAQHSLLAADNLYKPAGAPLKTNTWSLGTSRFLVFLRRSGDAYTPVADLNGLAPIYGSGLGTDRVTWFACTTLDETLATIEKALSTW